MRRRLLIPALLALATAAPLGSLAAQDAAPPAAPAQPRTPPTTVAPAPAPAARADGRAWTTVSDSARAVRDDARRYRVRLDSLQPMVMRGFSLRRVRIGVVVRTRPSESDSIGALLDAVTPGGPAATAGLRAGDIITRFGGTPLAVKPADLEPGVRVASPGLRLVELVAQTSPNDTVTVTYRRGGKQQTTKVVTAAEPQDLEVVVGEGGSYGWTTPQGFEPLWIGGDSAEQRALELALRRSEAGRSALRTPEPMSYSMRWAMGGPVMGLELAPVNPQLGSYFGTTDGVLVVDAPTPAPLGIKAGDVILAVDGRKVSGPPQLLRILGSYAPDEPLKLEVMRQKKRITLQGTIGG